MKFLLTRLMRGVTFEGKDKLLDMIISTHTPHARRDLFIRLSLVLAGNFYSHASCEA